VNEDMVGAGINVNPASKPVPPPVVTETSPEVPLATSAVIVKSSTTIKEVADTPPKLTSVAPVKSVPVIVIVVPLPALVGLKEVTTGCAHSASGNKTTAILKINLIFTCY
jgi:hypothetical protein